MSQSATIHPLFALHQLPDCIRDGLPVRPIRCTRTDWRHWLDATEQSLITAASNLTDSAAAALDANDTDTSTESIGLVAQIMTVLRPLQDARYSKAA